MSFNLNTNKNFFANLAGEKKEDNNNATFVASSSKNKKSKKDDDIEIEKLDELDTDVNSDFDDDEEGQLTIDVYQDNSNIYIESPVAGVLPEDIDIAITPESVSIKGKRQKKEKIKKDDYLYQECFWGSFSRSVILPQEVDPDKANASLQKGVLKISLPKIDRLKSKKIKVRID